MSHSGDIVKTNVKATFEQTERSDSFSAAVTTAGLA